MLQNFLLCHQHSKQIGKARSLSESYVHMLSCDNSWPRLKILDWAEKVRTGKNALAYLSGIFLKNKKCFKALTLTKY